MGFWSFLSTVECSYFKGLIALRVSSTLLQLISFSGDLKRKQKIVVHFIWVVVIIEASRVPPQKK